MIVLVVLKVDPQIRNISVIWVLARSSESKFTESETL